MSALPIAIVMPSFARGHLLARTLPPCLRQGVAEVIVVDDGSAEPLERAARAAAEAAARAAGGGDVAPLRVVRLGRNRGSCAARNAGADAATSEWLLFVDDDALLDDGYARTLLDHARAAGADAAAGRRLWLAAGESLDHCRATRTRRVAADALVDRRHFAYDDEADFAADALVPMACAIMLVRRSWFARVRYDEARYRRSGFREETDFQVALARAGGRLLACPHARCFNLHKDEIGRAGGQRRGTLLRYEWNLLRNDAAFRRKHFGPLREELGFAPGLTPWLGALHHYLGHRVPSKLRHLLAATRRSAAT